MASEGKKGDVMADLIERARAQCDRVEANPEPGFVAALVGTSRALADALEAVGRLSPTPSWRRAMKDTDLIERARAWCAAANECAEVEDDDGKADDCGECAYCLLLALVDRVCELDQEWDLAVKHSRSLEKVLADYRQERAVERDKLRTEVERLWATLDELSRIAARARG